MATVSKSKSAVPRGKITADPLLFENSYGWGLSVLSRTGDEVASFPDCSLAEAARIMQTVSLGDDSVWAIAPPAKGGQN